MNTKKTGRAAIRIDESLPTKTDAAQSLARAGEPPAVRRDAATKPDASDVRASSKAASPRAGDGPAKASFVRTPARSSRPMQDLPAMITADADADADAAGDGSTPEAGPTNGSDGYVRMRVRVREGELRVVDARLVDGPLLQASGFPAGNLYEVTLDGRLLHAGALPDLGIQRSFPDPDAKEGPRTGHHIAEREAYEFTVRIPANEVTTDSVGRVELVLHRVKSEARTDRLGSEPLELQFARDVRPVARLRGLPEKIVPEALVRRGRRAARPE